MNIETFAGYNYSYPFLSIGTGIHVEDNFVQPLFKHIFNIEHPTMAFIGLPMTSNNLHLFDLQVKKNTSFRNLIAQLNHFIAFT